MEIFEVLIFVTMGAWVLFEISLLVRDRRHGIGSTDADRGTRLLNAVLVVATVVVCGNLSTTLHVLVVPAANWFRAVGLVIVLLGLGLRLWAIRTLGAAFRTTVEVDHGQRIVTEGPYRWVRHPSYTGLLLITVGFGIAFANWLLLCSAPCSRRCLCYIGSRSKNHSWCGYSVSPTSLTRLGPSDSSLGSGEGSVCLFGVSPIAGSVAFM